MPDPELEIRGWGEGRSSGPLDGEGGGSPKFFRLFGPQFGLIIRGGGGGGGGVGSPWIRHWLFVAP